MQTVNWGVLGASEFARKQMAPAIHAARGARLAALASASPNKAQAFNDFAPDMVVHDSYDALLADPGIDAVYIPLPNHMHVEWTLRALDAGKHVLCEKPIALKEDEFDALIARRDAVGRLAAEAFMIVHHPQWQWVRQQVQNEGIGRLRHVSGIFSFENRADTGNIRNRAETGGGALRDIGVYVLGAARYVSGAEPEDVRARIRWDDGVDGFTAIDADFEGFTYSAYVSMRMHPFQEMTFHGEDGLIKVVTPFNAGVFGEARVELHKPGLVTETVRFPSENHYVLQVEAFGRSVREGAEYPCPLEFSRGTQRVIDRVFAAADDLS